jgi:hypothetical protein
MAAILLAGILILSTQFTTFLSIINEINKTNYKDLYLTRCARKLLLSHHYRHSDKSIFTMFFLNLKKYVKLKLTFVMADLFTLAPTPPPPFLADNTQYSTEAKFLEPD